MELSLGHVRRNYQIRLAAAAHVGAHQAAMTLVLDDLDHRNAATNSVKISVTIPAQPISRNRLATMSSLITLRITPSRSFAALQSACRRFAQL
jgi:hypothetical protein